MLFVMGVGSHFTVLTEVALVLHGRTWVFDCGTAKVLKYIEHRYKGSGSHVRFVRHPIDGLYESKI